MTDALDEWVAEYFSRRPVNATFAGVHEHDDRLPDWSPTGRASLDTDMRAIVARLHAEFPAPASESTYRDHPDLLDAELMRAFCEIQLSENTSLHGVRGNPALWTGEAVFAVIALMIRDFAPLALRVRSAIARMNAIPAFLADARACLGHQPLPAAWVERAIRDCAGAAILFERGVTLWLASGEDDPAVTADAQAAAAKAVRAFSEFAKWISGRPAAPESMMVCGTVHYDLLLRRGHQCHRPRADLLAAAHQQLDVERRRLTEMAAAQGGSWSEVQTRLADDHPSAGEYLKSFGDEWLASHRTIVAADVVTWPDWPIAYAEIPTFTREAAPYLYFLFYRSPAPLDPYHLHTYVVAPLPPGDPEPHLRSWNRSVIRLNHVLHHGGVGHHVQNWHAYHRAPSRVGKLAAVDCASRIAMFCGGTMAEGWACYATGLMGELGGLTPLELVAEQHGRVRMLARAVVDLSFHAGELSFGDAIALFTDRTEMNPSAARAEVIKCSMFPGTAVMYWIGTQGILDLRERRRRTEGSALSLRAFHDELLGHGSIPVPLVARLMGGEET